MPFSQVQILLSGMLRVKACALVWGLTWPEGIPTRCCLRADTLSLLLEDLRGPQVVVQLLTTDTHFG